MKLTIPVWQTIQMNRTGITIDMHTGEVLHLQDIIGEEWTPAELLKTSAFDTDWIDQLKEDIEKDTLSDYNSYFYITDKKFDFIFPYKTLKRFPLPNHPLPLLR